MKKNYRKEYGWRHRHPGDFRYVMKNRGYYRRIRTYQEIRRNVGDETDFRDEPVKLKFRGNRSSWTLDPRNDFPRSRNWKKSWKDFTKHKKQWMVGEDPAPVHDRKPMVSWIRLLALEYCLGETVR